MTNISRKSLIGIATLIIFIIVLLIAFYSINNYKGFFITSLIGIVFIALNYLYTISMNSTTNNLFDLKTKRELIKSCPEYWRKEIVDDKIICTSKDINENTSIAEINKLDGYNTLKYKTINLSDINNNEGTLDLKCNKILKEYNYNKDVEDKIDNKLKVTWTEYRNKCVKDL